MTLLVETRFLRMQLTSPGRLLPWLGPALRGVAAREVKDQTCRWPTAARDGRWKYCRGCPHQGPCPYGATFEPDAPPEGTLSRGMADGQRAISLAPCFPVAGEGRAGDVVQVRAMFLGHHAVDAAPTVVSAMINPARRLTLGSDQAAIVFQEQTPEPGWPAGRHALCPADFSGPPQVTRGRIPWLQLELTSPLFLKESSGRAQRAQPILDPTFAQLFRACLRVVGRAFAVFGGGTLEGYVDFAGLKAAAENVPTRAAFWQPFRQGHRSNRRLQQYDLVGAVGNAVFADIPVNLLPWLVWGGRLGVGEHRVAGAGCWQLTIL